METYLMYDFDSDHQYFRWPTMKARLERTLIDMKDYLDGAATVVEYSAPSAKTIRGTAFETFKTGYFSSEGKNPEVIEWVNDDDLLERFDVIHAKVGMHMRKQLIDMAPAKLTWRSVPTVGIHWPATDEELVAGVRTYNNVPVVWSKWRLATERIVS